MRAPDAGHRARVCRAVAAEHEQLARIAIRLLEAALDVCREAPQIADQAVEVLRPRVRIGDPAGIVRGIAMVEPGRASEAWAGRKAVA